MKGFSPGMTQFRQAARDTRRARVVGPQRLCSQPGQAIGRTGLHGAGSGYVWRRQGSRTPKDAGAFAASVMKDPTVALARFRARCSLKSEPTVDPDKIAAIGYCMGGAIVLNAVRQGTDLDAVASFTAHLEAFGDRKTY